MILILGLILVVILICVILFKLFYKKSPKKSPLNVLEKNRNKNIAELEKELQKQGVDTTEIVSNIDSSVRKLISTKCSLKPPCAKGYDPMENAHGETCCYINPDSTIPTKAETTRLMLKDVSTEIIVTETTELVLKGINKVFIYLLRTRGEDAAKKIAQKGFVKLGDKLSKMALRQTRNLANNAMKKSLTMLGMGPVTWALLAFELLIFAMDVYDPAGYQDFVSNEIALNLRNIAEDNFSLIIANDGGSLPGLAPFDYGEIPGQYEQMNVLPKVRLRIYEDVIDNTPDDIFESFANEDDIALVGYIEDETDKILLAYMESAEYKKEVCDSYKKHGKNDVKWVRGAGCSLNKDSCNNLNRQENKKDPNERNFAIYSTRYRVRTGGTNKKPRMSDRNLPSPACMLSPLIWSKEACEGKGTWRDKHGMCDFSRSYCTKKGLVSNTMSNGITNCVMFPGQKILEMFLGATITRMLGQTMNPESYKMIFDGDTEVLKQWGLIIAFISQGPTGWALNGSTKFVPGYDSWADQNRKRMLKGIATGTVKAGEGIADGTILIGESISAGSKGIYSGMSAAGKGIDNLFTNEKAKKFYSNVNKTSKKVARDFEKGANETMEDIEEFFGDLLKDSMRNIKENFEKLGKISEKLGREAALETAKLGQKAIDDVEDLIKGITSALQLKKVRDGIGKGIGGIKDVANEIGNFFKKL
jgi:hypothetical protein